MTHGKSWNASTETWTLLSCQRYDQRSQTRLTDGSRRSTGLSMQPASSGNLRTGSQSTRYETMGRDQPIAEGRQPFRPCANARQPYKGKLDGKSSIRRSQTPPPNVSNDEANASSPESPKRDAQYTANAGYGYRKAYPCPHCGSSDRIDPQCPTFAKEKRRRDRSVLLKDIRAQKGMRTTATKVTTSRTRLRTRKTKSRAARQWLRLHVST